MKEMFKIFKFVLLICGVFGADEDEVKTVMEGDSVTLNLDPTQIQGFIQIQWRFGKLGSTIAKIVGKTISYEDEEIFEDCLQLDQTGSLTIKNMRTKHSGRYKAEISHSTGTLDIIFIVTVFVSPDVIDAVKGGMKLMSVTEGDPVILQTDVPQLTRDMLVVWRSGDEGKLIAKHDIEAKSSPFYVETDGRFRDRLKLDQTGSLTITNSRTNDSGLYRVKISSNNQTTYKRFTVTVSGSFDTNKMAENMGRQMSRSDVLALLFDSFSSGNKVDTHVVELEDLDESRSEKEGNGVDMGQQIEEETASKASRAESDPDLSSNSETDDTVLDEDYRPEKDDSPDNGSDTDTAQGAVREGDAGDVLETYAVQRHRRPRPDM